MDSLSTNVVSLERRGFELTVQVGMIVSSEVQKMFLNFLRTKGEAGRYGDNVGIFRYVPHFEITWTFYIQMPSRSERRTRLDTFSRQIVSAK